jgi:3-hydroxybutyryl-CoA dehydrogenase
MNSSKEKTASQIVAVIGAGTMGNGITHVFAQNGYAVTMIDISKDALDKGLSTYSPKYG